jgi:hypothetical protein
LVGWEVAAALGEVAGEVAEDVDELEPLAIAGAEGDHFREREGCEGGDGVGAGGGPEFADAACDEPCVFFEGGGVREGAGGGVVREAGEVEGLPVNDVGEDRVGEGLLRCGEGGAGLEAIGEPLEEDAFAGVGDGLGAGGGGLEEGVGRVRVGEGVLELIEEEEPVEVGLGGGIGDGVGGAGEEVGDRERIADRAGEDAETEVERSGDGGEEVPGDGA